jgi:uncharacterized membrane protein YbhN (UPF0104 family)
VKPSAAWIKGLVKYLLAAGLLALVVGMNWTRLVELFSRPPQPAYFVAAFALMVGVILLQYLRWYLLVRALDLPLTLPHAVRLGLVGTYYNTFLPGSIGGDFVKAYLIAKGQPTRRAAAASTVIADRVLGLFGLILYAAAVGGGYWAAGDERIRANEPLQSIILTCVALATGFVAGYGVLKLIPAAVGEKLRRQSAALGEVWDAARRYRERPGTILTCVAVSAAAHTAMMVAYHLAVQVFPPADTGLIATLPETFIIAPLGFIAQAIPLAPGGLGVGEAVFGGLYSLLRGAEGGAVGLAGRLTLRVAEWAIGLVGFVAYEFTKSEIPITDPALEVTSGPPVESSVAAV